MGEDVEAISPRNPTLMGPAASSLLLQPARLVEMRNFPSLEWPSFGLLRSRYALNRFITTQHGN